MPWEIDRDEAFEKALSHLKKRFPRAEADILEAFKNGHPQKTNALAGFDEKLWKGRARSSDLRRGTSGGFRIIYYWDKSAPNWACFATVYFKGDCENLPVSELSRVFIRVKARIQRMKEEREKPNASPDSG